MKIFIAIATIFISLMAVTFSSPSAMAQNTYIRYNCGPASGIGLSIPKCTKEDSTVAPSEPSTLNNPIIAWMVFFINLFGVIIVLGGAIMLALGGVQYTASRDNAQATQAAKQRIYNVIIGLLMYMFFYGFMQWLVPGGVF